MKRAVLPRLFAAVTSVAVTVFLFDTVAMMGRSADSDIAASAAIGPTAYQVAVSGH